MHKYPSNFATVLPQNWSSNFGDTQLDELKWKRYSTAPVLVFGWPVSTKPRPNAWAVVRGYLLPAMALIAKRGPCKSHGKHKTGLDAGCNSAGFVKHLGIRYTHTLICGIGFRGPLFWDKLFWRFVCDNRKRTSFPCYQPFWDTLN